LYLLFAFSSLKRKISESSIRQYAQAMHEAMNLVIAIYFLVSLMPRQEADAAHCNECDNKLFLQKIKSVPGVVKAANPGEPIFNGHRYYVRVEKKLFLDKVFQSDAKETERVFICNRTFSDRDTGRVVLLSGKFSRCLTGNHGLPSNHLMPFYILEP
jgi:hypothetical protein